MLFLPDVPSADPGNDFYCGPPRTKTYPLSLHDALPILNRHVVKLDRLQADWADKAQLALSKGREDLDRKSTRLNSSHRCISYAVFCLKKKKLQNISGPGATACPPSPAPSGARRDTSRTI